MNKATDRAAPQPLNNSSSASSLNLAARGGPFFQVNMVLNGGRGGRGMGGGG